MREHRSTLAPALGVISVLHFDGGYNQDERDETEACGCPHDREDPMNIVPSDTHLQGSPRYDRVLAISAGRRSGLQCSHVYLEPPLAHVSFPSLTCFRHDPRDII